jgi:hypothetical protein
MRAYAVAAAMTLACSGAQAVTLAPGNNILTGTTVGVEPQLAGAVVADEDQAFTFTTAGGTLSGFVQNRVIKAIDNTYDFAWRIHDISFSGTTPFDIQEFRIGKFGNTVVGLNANYRLDGTGDVGPNRAFVFGAPQNNYVNFLFDQGLFAGQGSYFMFLDTQETSYGRTAIYDFGRAGSTQISGLYSTFGPPAPVPEPTSWALFIGGFGLIGAALRRRVRPAVRFA